MAKKTRAGLLGLISATVVAGSVILTAAPASAVVTPHVTVETYRAKNLADSYGQVQHYDKVGSGTKVGNWAKKGGNVEPDKLLGRSHIVLVQLQVLGGVDR